MTPSNLNIIQKESDLKKIYELISGNLKFIIICALLGIFISFLINRNTVPIFKFSASMLIREHNRQQASNMNDFLNSNLLGANQNFQNEIWVAKSSPVIEQAIRNLDLNVNYYRKKQLKHIDAYNTAPFKVMLLKKHLQPVNVKFKITIQNNSEFFIQGKAKDASFVLLDDPEVVKTIKNWEFEQSCQFGKLIESNEMAFIITLDSNNFINTPQKNLWSFEIKDMPSQVNAYKSQLEFNIIDKDATVIQIVYKSQSISKGKNFVDELMNVYSIQNLERKNYIASNTIAYIEKQLGEISDSLSQTEDNLQRFRSSNQLLNASEQASGITEQYLNLQNQLAELVTKKRYYDYVADFLAKNDDFANIMVPASMGIQDPLLNNLLADLIAMQSQRSNLIQNQQEKNPMVQKLGIQIENIRNTITDNIDAVRKTTDISIEEMSKRIHRVEAEISRLPGTQRQLGGIERQYRLNDAIYNYLLEKRAEAKITQASNLPDNLIIEPAKVVGNGPIAPKKVVNLLIGLLLGLLIPFTVVLIGNSLTNKIESQENVANLTDFPVMGKVLHNSWKTSNVLFAYPKSTIAESFRSLRTNLDFHFRGAQKKVILITSSLEGEGKSFNALNIAMSYAQMERKTLLIDFDLRKSTEYFDKKNDPDLGISTYLADKYKLDDIIFKSPHVKLHYILSGPIPPNPMELLALGKTRELMEHLKEQYDCIVIDTAPLGAVSDAFLLMDHADVKIIIARLNYTLKRVFAFIMNDLRQKNIHNVYVVLNDNRSNKDQYGYGYGYATKKKLIARIMESYAQPNLQ
jgi:capsular exopolysaccharide synthesis family protein